MNAVMCNYAEETGSCYTIWTNVDTEIQVPHDFTHMHDLKMLVS